CAGHQVDVHRVKPSAHRFANGSPETLGKATFASIGV
ncbi:MAG: hypothetical protein ACI8XD_001532, partial [Thermoproteota archaeon]